MYHTRTESEHVDPEPASYSESDTNSPTSSWERHDDLYISDGTVVLHAENVLFRVPLGLLARHSGVFKDMASLTTQPADAETYDGCPLVRLHDSRAELSYFLKAIFDFDYFPGTNEPEATPYTYEVVAGILRLSNKYAVPGLRTRAIAYMSRFFHSRHDEAKYINGARQRSSFTVPCFAPISLFRECQVEQFLPWAYYMACQEGFEALLRADAMDETDRLSIEGAHTALRGWRKLVKAETLISIKTFEGESPMCASYGCSNVSKAALLKKLLNRAEYVPWFDVPHTMVIGCCPACTVYQKEIHEQEMERLWKELPNYFGLRPWNELLKE